jgi:hypothetical protein
MRTVLRFAFVVATISMVSACSSNEPSEPIGPVIEAYDTLEYRYQQVSDLAIDLMANISMDPSIKVKQVQDLLDREPVVSLDFRKIAATQRDISRFVTYQRNIDKGLRAIFTQLGQAPKWREAPLILEIRNKYELLNDSIMIATKAFNVAARDASLQLAVAADTSMR